MLDDFSCLIKKNLENQKKIKHKYIRQPTKRERGRAQQMNTTSETQRCLLKCNVQQWDGAIVVTRFRVYACAPDQTRCAENTKGSGEPGDHRGGNRASFAITVCVAR